MNELNSLLKNMFPTIDFDNEIDLIGNRRIDSLDLLRLIDALEQKYEISIPVEDVTVENFSSIKMMHSLICRLCSQCSAITKPPTCVN